ncbi:Low density lipoprotein receptor adapter protein 1 [Triplophysa tibetana]|uniref:Low density lipoprotein receptor adapter protein 1 n=1 Tax=Triplophysa tibetana TaxID=1572043 RepID=A0A5A9NFG2_9TELE|nr:Low density lipoprotein receptor adapter protein 1 [Triplophysa tibetana]
MNLKLQALGENVGCRRLDGVSSRGALVTTLNVEELKTLAENGVKTPAAAVLVIHDAELPENWTDTKETLLEGMVFNVKYLGMTLVGQPKGEDMAAAAIRRIVTTAHASANAKKFRKVTLTVSPKGIIISDTDTNDLIEDVSIYSGMQRAHVAGQNALQSTRLSSYFYFCLIILIQAQAVTLTVAQAFKLALDLWEIAQEEEDKTQALKEHKYRKPFFSAFLSPSPRSNTRRRPFKHDSWDVEESLDDAFSSCKNINSKGAHEINIRSTTGQ